MVSLRCKMIVKAELKKLRIKYLIIDLGSVELEGAMTKKQEEQLKENLQVSGLELMEDKKSILIEKIKCCGSQAAAWPRLMGKTVR